jgi:hypothetical protein
VNETKKSFVILAPARSELEGLNSWAGHWQRPEEEEKGGWLISGQNGANTFDQGSPTEGEDSVLLTSSLS